MSSATWPEAILIFRRNRPSGLAILAVTSSNFSELEVFRLTLNCPKAYRLKEYEAYRATTHKSMHFANNIWKSAAVVFGKVLENAFSYGYWVESCT